VGHHGGRGTTAAAMVHRVLLIDKCLVLDLCVGMVLTYRRKNSDIPSRWNFFSLRVPLRGLVSEKKILLLSHLTYPSFCGGYLSKMLGYLRHARWNGGWIFFVSNVKAFFDMME